jgi:hypothetical protein
VDIAFISKDNNTLQFFLLHISGSERKSVYIRKLSNTCIIVWDLLWHVTRNSKFPTKWNTGNPNLDRRSMYHQGQMDLIRPVFVDNNLCADRLLNCTSSLQPAFVPPACFAHWVLLALEYQIPNAITCAHVQLRESVQSHWSHPQLPSQSMSQGLVWWTKCVKDLHSHGSQQYSHIFSTNRLEVFTSFVESSSPRHCAKIWNNCCCNQDYHNLLHKSYSISKSLCSLTLESGSHEKHLLNAQPGRCAQMWL